MARDVPAASIQFGRKVHTHELELLVGELLDLDVLEALVHVLTVRLHQATRHLLLVLIHPLLNLQV